MPMSSLAQKPRPAAHAPQSVGYLVRYSHRALVRALGVELQPHDISSGQWSVLRVLWDEEGFSQVELSERMRVEKASLTGVLDAMERRGLIVRARNTQDRRKINIHLTAQARALKDKLLPFAARINKRATRGMSAAEIATLHRLLTQLIHNLED